jgi:predicted Fe-S protein YdhL (DUF1289 family)
VDWFGWNTICRLCYRSSTEEYLTYTTEETEKMEVLNLAEKLDGNIEQAIKQLAEKAREKRNGNKSNQ